MNLHAIIQSWYDSSVGLNSLCISIDVVALLSIGLVLSVDKQSQAIRKYARPGNCEYEYFCCHVCLTLWNRVSNRDRFAHGASIAFSHIIRILLLAA